MYVTGCALCSLHVNNYITDTINQAVDEHTPLGNRIRQIKQSDTSYQSDFRANLKTTMSTSTSSRRQSYMGLNSELVKSPWLDSSNKQVVPECYRIAVTRLRLGSHYLRVETGRWSRTPLELRLCPCTNSIQTEAHVLISCPFTEQLREEMHMQCDNLVELFNAQNRLLKTAEYCERTLNI